MRITYVAKHKSGGNDDEGSIADALTRLGVTVTCLQENVTGETVNQTEPDFVMFHKWSCTHEIRKVKAKKGFWYFDLVGTCGDESTIGRSTVRKTWMAFTLPVVDIAWMTDGDFIDDNVLRHNLKWLPQGFDQRIELSNHLPGLSWSSLIVGNFSSTGLARRRFFKDIKEELGGRVQHVNGIYRTALARVVRQVSSVICPPCPVSNRYWSNRIYLMAGFGGLVLHKRSAGVLTQFTESEVLYYDDFNELKELIFTYLDPSTVIGSNLFRTNAMQRVAADHMYFHRAKTLITDISNLTGVPCPTF